MRKVCFIIIALFYCAFSVFAQQTIDLKPVTVNAVRAADTVFGSWKFSIADYEFYEDKLILLTFEKSLEHAQIILANRSQKVLNSYSLPDEAKELYKDYQGYINVICVNHIFRIKIINKKIHLGSLPIGDYTAMIMPCIDSIGSDIYFSNYQKDYPEFSYYAYNTKNKKAVSFKRVCDQNSLDSYNMEYYFLTSRQRLEARKLADQYGVDQYRIAAHMSGLVNSMFYSPLYAPLYIINDTVCVFDHYNNAILKYNKKQHLVDSIRIDYNHPKNWREWKHKVLVDKITNRTYALYQKNGFHYLKHIDLYSGKIIGSFKLTNQYVEKIKVKDGYVYYVYRPYESLQESFLYKELITEF
jgi:hypothetical protein